MLGFSLNCPQGVAYLSTNLPPRSCLRSRSACIFWLFESCSKTPRNRSEVGQVDIERIPMPRSEAPCNVKAKRSRGVRPNARLSNSSSKEAVFTAAIGDAIWHRVRYQHARRQQRLGRAKLFPVARGDESETRSISEGDSKTMPIRGEF